MRKKHDITVWAYVRGYEMRWGQIAWTFKEKNQEYYDFINSPKIKIIEINHA